MSGPAMERGRLERTLFLVNPAAGGGRAGRVWERLLAVFPDLAAAPCLIAADPAAARARLAAELAGMERVVAVGGDGTVHLLVNALLADLADRPAAARPAVGLVPAGTGSDLARSLDLPSRPAAALATALAAVPRPLDAVAVAVGGGAPRFVVNVASAGLSGTVVAAVDALARRGPLTYLATTLRCLVRYRPLPCRIEADGELLYDGPFFLAACANGRCFGKGMRVAPRARWDDGLLDVVVVPPVPLWQTPWRLPQFLTGRHLALPFVRFTQAREVRLTPAPGFPPFDVDGESLPAGPAEIRLLPAALRVLAPAARL